MDYIGNLRKYVGTQAIIMTGACVLIRNEKDEILLHHRRDNDCWGLPGGAMELGETLEETAKREVFEEVALTCYDLKLFNVYSGPDLYHKYPDGNEVYNVTVAYTCDRFSGIIDVELTEGKDAKFFALDEIPENLSPLIRMIVEEYIKAEIL